MATPPETDGPTARPWQLAECADDELVDFLEPDQLAATAAQPVARAQTTPRVRAALWAMRIVALVVSAMVIYTFVYQTVHPGR